jgi:hypothetical protein
MTSRSSITPTSQLQEWKRCQNEVKPEGLRRYNAVQLCIPSFAEADKERDNVGGTQR